MNNNTIFLRANKDKAVFDLRSEVNNLLAPNIILISSDNVKVKGHSNILASCPYFRELFKRVQNTDSKFFIFDEGLPGDVLEFMVKYIYTGEYSLLGADKLPEVLRATSEEKYNIPELAKGYLLKQFDSPGGLNQSNWHIFYKNGIKLNLEEEICNRIYAFLKDHLEFYKSEEFISLTFDQICKIMKSPNLPFESNMTLTEAKLIWATENKVGKDKLAVLSKICINPVQNGIPNLQASNSPILDASVQSASTQACPQSTVLSEPHCSTTRKRTRSISPQINTNQRNKRSNVVQVYDPPKYSWDSAQLLFFGKAEAKEPRYLWTYSFQTGEIKRMAKLPIENLEDSSLLVSQDRIYSIGGRVKHKGNYKAQDLVWSFVTNDLENLDKVWDEGPKLNRANHGALTLLFRNMCYLFSGHESYNSGIEKWNMDGNPGIWENNNRDMLNDRKNFGVAFLDNIIYMIGGRGVDEVKLEYNTLDSGESYNIDDKSRSLLPNMNQARSDLRVVALEDRIYAIGGYNDDFEKLASVESYKPGDSSWKKVASMKPRTNGSAFVLDDMIYVGGGNSGYRTWERYCHQEDRWTIVQLHANLPEWAELSSAALIGPNNF